MGFTLYIWIIRSYQTQQERVIPILTDIISLKLIKKVRLLTKDLTAAARRRIILSAI
ncbi:MAG: hypothetical protein ACR2MD_10235 [Aridibacter sp.]|jgi:hypothetical protein